MCFSQLDRFWLVKIFARASNPADSDRPNLGANTVSDRFTSLLLHFPLCSASPISLTVYFYNIWRPQNGWPPSYFVRKMYGSQSSHLSLSLSPLSLSLSACYSRVVALWPDGGGGSVRLDNIKSSRMGFPILQSAARTPLPSQRFFAHLKPSKLGSGEICVSKRNVHIDTTQKQSPNISPDPPSLLNTSECRIPIKDFYEFLGRAERRWRATLGLSGRVVLVLMMLLCFNQICRGRAQLPNFFLPALAVYCTSKSKIILSKVAKTHHSAHQVLHNLWRKQIRIRRQRSRESVNLVSISSSVYERHG